MMNLHINEKKREPITLSDDRLPGNVVGVIGGHRRLPNGEEAEGLWFIIQVRDGETTLHYATKFCRPTLGEKANLSAYMRAFTGASTHEETVARVKEMYLSENGDLDAGKVLGTQVCATLERRGEYYNLKELGPVHPKVGVVEVDKETTIPDWVLIPYDWQVTSIDLVDGLDIKWTGRKPKPDCWFDSHPSDITPEPGSDQNLPF